MKHGEVCAGGITAAAAAAAAARKKRSRRRQSSDSMGNQRRRPVTSAVLARPFLSYLPHHKSMMRKDSSNKN